jgi:hypothetical protein
MPVLHESGSQMFLRFFLCAAITALVVRFSAGLMKISTSGEQFLVETAFFETSAQRSARQASLPMIAGALLC